MTSVDFRVTADGAIATEYAFREGLGLHTDIANVLVFDISAFGRVDEATTLQSSIFSQDWLRRAVCRFAFTFGNTRNPSILHFFSDADALSYQLRRNELAISSTALATAGFAQPNLGAALAIAGLARHGLKGTALQESSDQVALPR